jgi:hypothetical protein
MLLGDLNTFKKELNARQSVTNEIVRNFLNQINLQELKFSFLFLQS